MQASQHISLLIHAAWNSLRSELSILSFFSPLGSPPIGAPNSKAYPAVVAMINMQPTFRVYVGTVVCTCCHFLP